MGQRALPIGSSGRESAVECFGGVSGGVLRALPIGFHGGKARSDAVEGHLEGTGALCLHGSGEGKRGRVLWRGLWRG